MAKQKKRAPRKPPPAQWFWESRARQQAHEEKAFAAKSDAAYENHMLRAADEEARRENERAYIHDSIVLLRKFAHGFEARDGFDLRQVVSLKGRKLEKVKKLAALIRQEQASPHVEAVARTKGQRKALETYTGQRDIPDRKRFIVFTEQPDKTEVRIVTPKKRKKPKKKKPAKRKGKPVDVAPEDLEPEPLGPPMRKPRVELTTRVKGGVSREEFFHIEDYLGDTPETFKDIKKALKKMLPDMPKGYYVLVTSNHGNIGVPAQRGNLLDMIEQDYIHYDKVPGTTSRKDDRGLAGVVVGFKLVSFTKDGADREYIERLTRRQMLNRERRAARKRSQRERRSRITGRR